MRMLKMAAVATAGVVGFGAQAVAGDVMDAVMEKGFIQCGVSQGVPGFSNPTTGGDWEGIDVDVCRAVAAAAFGDADAVKYTPLTAKERFTALQSGEIDMLSRNTTWTLVRDVQLGLTFAGVNFYDGQGFMVRKDLGVSSATELDGASVCTNLGTTTELNMADFFRSQGMAYTPVVFEKADEVVAAYDAGRCDVYTTDKSALAAQRTKLKDPSAHMVLPETVSKEPLGPVVAEGDEQFADLVRWSLYAMVEAEEMGVSSANVDEMKGGDNPGIKRLLGVEGDMGPILGVSKEWAYNIIKQVGNYGEVFDKHIGPNTPVGLSRDQNALWKDGGLMYAMPVR